MTDQEQRDLQQSQMEGAHTPPNPHKCVGCDCAEERIKQQKQTINELFEKIRNYHQVTELLASMIELEVWIDE